MYFRLAALLGKTIGELDASITHAEFAEWCAFYQLEPWGSAAEDDRWRQQYALSWNASFKGDPPVFLNRDPVEMSEADPFEAYLERRFHEQEEDDDA